MHYGKKSPSMGTPSIYSHVTTRSSANLRSSRSVKSIKIPWYQKPILTNAIVFDVQRSAMFTAVFSLLLAIFTVFTAVFDIYCLSQATPGSTHYGYHIISYEFVYVGNKHIRNALIVGALFSLLGGIAVLVTSIILINALRKEHEKKMIPWLYSFAIFTMFRLLAFLFFTYGWLIVYSLHIELSDLTRLEDLAHLRIGTMQSLNASTTHSIAGSRPTTPHSTVSTMPVN
ncbi:hypothetical protein PV326_008882 [Microctonus aethiopoides]|nr:hypothetical protein PV326_008882 [Microctonus aethiopoides]